MSLQATEQLPPTQAEGATTIATRTYGPSRRPPDITTTGFYQRLTRSLAPLHTLVPINEGPIVNKEDEGSGNEVYIPSPIARDSESVDLDDDFDQMMKAPASSLSPLPTLQNADIEEEDDMVDYNDETPEELIDVLKGLDSDTDTSLVGGLSANAGPPPGSNQGRQEVD
jgi:hypothetical protein